LVNLWFKFAKVCLFLTFILCKNNSNNQIILHNDYNRLGISNFSDKKEDVFRFHDKIRFYNLLVCHFGFYFNLFLCCHICITIWYAINFIAKEGIPLTVCRSLRKCERPCAPARMATHHTNLYGDATSCTYILFFFKLIIIPLDRTTFQLWESVLLIMMIFNEVVWVIKIRMSFYLIRV